MKKYILSILSVCLLLCIDLRAQYSDEDIFQSRDTIVDCKSYKVRVQTLDYSSFKKLEEKHSNLSESLKMTNLCEVENLLGDSYKISYWIRETIYEQDTTYIYSLDYVERKGVYRQMSFLEDSDFQGYFPKEKVFLHYGGHSSDEAFFIESGEPAYNPIYSATQKDGKYRLVGMHNGQEGIDGEIQLKDEKTGKYNSIFTIGELANLLQAPNWDLYFWNTQFWHKNTLYMCTGYGNYSNKEKDWDRNNSFISLSFTD